MEEKTYKSVHIARQFALCSVDPRSPVAFGLGNCETVISVTVINRLFNDVKSCSLQATIVILAVTPSSYSMLTT